MQIWHEMKASKTAFALPFPSHTTKTKKSRLRVSCSVRAQKTGSKEICRFYVTGTTTVVSCDTCVQNIPGSVA